ncbi:MAG TPA: deoxyribodipyrimidine photo-lyase [Dinghuibacter sp.]|uniref:cryptochrome/photolyase family protein n=1 Tax=Dinghuibacter sp. TaxID=2024697 RepID=UPI002CAEBEA8|nr:deoxyribodipyrimidine photo-lyase [Dinghuibacter sp.]HTJ13823.1 deoxyribodipyrimidine photo-lyase [Dinghuibacter sp.]
MKNTVHLFWFRRDLRLRDNAGLYHALRSGVPVVPVFIFDRNILDRLEDGSDARVEFIYAALEDMQRTLADMGSTLDVFYGRPEDAFRHWRHRYDVQAVFANHDYEPYARERDKGVEGLRTYKDQVIFDREEVLKDDGRPYTVFTPYSKRWKALVNDFYLKPYPCEKYWGGFFRQAALPLPSLGSMGFSATGRPWPPRILSRSLVERYGETRDFPALENGTSHMGVHLRFGTVSIRLLAGMALGRGEVYLNELIWRDFYQMILWHFPHVGRGKAFHPAYDHIRWRYSEPDFQRWCEGRTGYPLVDAGMRQLNQTGYMHNRVRMVTASFLAKHLLIDWRWGEAYFAAKLLDFDLAANNGGWQWAVGSGNDAAPWFRVFNPTLQAKKFDKDLMYIRRWVPELDSLDYPAPMVDHEVARRRCLDEYTRAVKGGGM